MRLEVILDRVEENIAVLTDKEAVLYTCDATLLPNGVSDGAPLYAELDAEGNVIFLETRVVPAEMQNKRRLFDLFRKNPKNKNKF